MTILHDIVYRERRVIASILKLRKTSNFGVFAVGAKPPILEFLRNVRRTSDFGVLNIINNIFKTTQNLRFWSFCGGRKTSDFGVFA